MVRARDAVLVKASNSIGLARLVEAMAGEQLMLYLIAEQLGFPGLLNLIRYISFRAGGASATAMAIGLLMGPSFIRWLRARQGKGQPIRADGPQSHLAKRGTPTMGGLLILSRCSARPCCGWTSTAPMCGRACWSPPASG